MKTGRIFFPFCACVGKELSMKKPKETIVDDIFRPRENAILEFCILDGLEETAIGPVATSVHRHPFYEMIYVKSCDGEHIVDYKTYDNLENIVFLISPGQTHYWKNVKEVRGVLIYFTENFLFNSSMFLSSIWEMQLFKEIARDPAIHMNEAQAEQLEQILNIMLREYKEMDVNYPDMLRSCLTMLLINFQRQHRKTETQNTNPTDTTELMHRFENIIDQKVRENLSVTEYASLLGVSTGHLNNQVQKCKGVSAGTLIKRARIMEIKKLLLYTEMNITEISDLMNYMDVAYFCRFFKKETGVSPSDFRKANSEKTAALRGQTMPDSSEH